jgi:hypothetical protein
VSTEILHRFRQPRSTKIWNDKDGFGSPAVALRGWTITFAFLGGNNWRLNLRAAAAGAGWLATARLPNGLLVKVTHQNVTTINFTMIAFPVSWVYLVVRCPWSADPNLLPTYHLVAAGALNAETDCVLGVLRLGGAAPTFFTFTKSGPSWPLEEVEATEGLADEISFDLSHYRFTGDGVLPNGSPTIVFLARDLPYSMRRWYFNPATGAGQDFLRLNLKVELAGGAPPAPGNTLQLTASVYLCGDKTYSYVNDLGPATVTAARLLSPPYNAGDNVWFFRNEPLDVTALIPSPTADFDPVGAFFKVFIARLADTYAGAVSLNTCNLTYCRTRCGARI